MDSVRERVERLDVRQKEQLYSELQQCWSHDEDLWYGIYVAQAFRRIFKPLWYMTLWGGTAVITFMVIWLTKSWWLAAGAFVVCAAYSRYATPLADGYSCGDGSRDCDWMVLFNLPALWISNIIYRLFSRWHETTGYSKWLTSKIFRYGEERAAVALSGINLMGGSDGTIPL